MLSNRPAGWDRSIAAVARTFGVSWATAWRTIAAARQKIAALPKCPPRRLGLDETTFRSHRSFMIGLVDLDTSRLWDLIEGRSKKALAARLEALGEQVRDSVGGDRPLRRVQVGYTNPDNYRLRVLYRCA